MNIEPNNLELRDRGAEAMNRAGLATQAGMSLLFTLAAIPFYVIGGALLVVRDWIDAGCKVPEWLFPKWPRTEKEVTDAER